MYSRKGTKQIYGPGCAKGAAVPLSPDLDINTYLRSLTQVLAALNGTNRKEAAIENFTLLTNAITAALNSAGTGK